MIPKSRNTKEDSAQRQTSDSKTDASFASILESTVKKESPAAPASCHTCTYGANRKLQNFLYQSKEYTY